MELLRGINTIYCSSFSRSLAPGYRVGWIAAVAFAQQVMERTLAFSLCCPVLPQVALADVQESGAYDAHPRGIRRLFGLSAGHAWNDHVEGGVRRLGQRAQALLEG